MELLAILNPYLVYAKSSKLWASYWFNSMEPHTTDPIGKSIVACLLFENYKGESAPCVKFTFSMFCSTNLEDYKKKKTM